MPMTTDKIHRLVDVVCTKHSTMPAEKKLKTIQALHKVPLSKVNLDKLATIDDVDFTPEVEKNRQQRFEDAGMALVDAVDAGVDSLESFRSWLGSETDAGVNDIIDRAHAYVRLGERGRPETISEFR